MAKSIRRVEERTTHSSLPLNTLAVVDEHRLAVALLGVGSGLYVHVVGQVYLSEIALALLLPACALGWRRFRRNQASIRAVQIALGMWLAGALLGGLLVVGSTRALAQIVANAVVTILVLLALGRSIRTRREMVALTLGIGIGQILSVVVQPSTNASIEAWKFGGGIGVALVALSLNRDGKFSRLGLAAVAVISVILDTRSLALIALSALLLGAISDVLGRRLRPSALLAIFGLGTAVAGLITNAAYSFLIRSGAFGAGALAKFQAQGSGSPLLVLLGGRNETFFSVPSVWAHPIIGLGSSPILSFGAASNGLQGLGELGLSPASPIVDEPGMPLPVHSYLVEGWVHAGILGFVAWLIIFGWILRGTLQCALNLTEHRYLVIFLGVLASWNTLYSPYGGSQRFLLAATVLAIASFAEKLHSPLVEVSRLQTPMTGGEKSAHRSTNRSQGTVRA